MRSRTFVLTDYIPADALADRKARLVARRLLYRTLPRGHAPKALTGGAKEWQARLSHSQHSHIRAMMRLANLGESR